jgi:ATP-binding cassette subfamily B protein
MLATSATLVPPYLTKPLMDKLLIPYQNGQDHRHSELVSLDMLGLLGAALLGWSSAGRAPMCWRGYPSASAPTCAPPPSSTCSTCRVTYFGSKRTGDLIARIGAETDRIYVFLSLHLLDFATDVLMIGMTAVVVCSASTTGWRW